MNWRQSGLCLHDCILFTGRWKRSRRTGFRFHFLCLGLLRDWQERQRLLCFLPFRLHLRAIHCGIGEASGGSCHEQSPFSFKLAFNAVHHGWWWPPASILAAVRGKGKKKALGDSPDGAKQLSPAEGRLCKCSTCLRALLSSSFPVQQSYRMRQQCLWASFPAPPRVLWPGREPLEWFSDVKSDSWSNTIPDPLLCDFCSKRPILAR